MVPQALLSQQDPASFSFVAMANLQIKSLGSIDYVEIERSNVSGEAKQLIIFFMGHLAFTLHSKAI